jgi:hypothetical protein
MVGRGFGPSPSFRTLTHPLESPAERRHTTTSVGRLAAIRTTEAKGLWAYYWVSVAILAGLLYIPVSKMVWVLSVRRLERKTGQPLDQAQQQGQQNRARFIAIIACIVFSALFNYQILDVASHG